MCWIITLFLTAAPVLFAADAVVVDALDGRSDNKWDFQQLDGTKGLEWSADATHPGLRFNVAGIGSATLAAPVGTQPFRLTWQVEIDKGNTESWRYPGVVVGISSAAPVAQTAETLSILIGIHREGVAATLVTGPIYEPYREGKYPPPYSNFTQKYASPRGALNAGGGGGHFMTIGWPAKNVAGTTLRMEIIRDAENTVTFRIYHGALPAGSGPWVERKFQLPAKLAKIPLTHLVVKKVMNPGEYRDPGKDQTGGHGMSGWVRNLELGPADPAAWPRVAEVTGLAVMQAGATVVVRGKSFREGATVRVAGEPATHIKVVGPDQISLTLPAIPQSGRYPLTVVNPDGLSNDPGATVTVGRFIERIVPRDADTRGGQIVSLLGGGFDENTRVTLGGAAAEIVERKGSTVLRIKVPAGKEGRAEVKATSGANSFAGEPLFGYGPHPRLYFTAEQLSALRERFKSPRFEGYRKVILANASSDQSLDGKKPTSQTLLWAYLLTGERPYLDQALPLIDAEAVNIDHDEFNISAAEPMALAYDALQGELSELRLMAIEDYLDRVVRMYNERIAAGDWWYKNNPSNTIAIGAAGAGSAALALVRSTPAAELAVKNAVGAVKSAYDAIQPDGGNMEGTLYWNYGQTAYMRFAHMLQNVTGSDQKLLSAKGLNEQENFVKVNLGGDDHFFAFNDTQPWLTGWAICADLGARNNQPLMLWMADHMAGEFAAGHGPLGENIRGDIAAFAFLWRGDSATPKDFPGVPTVFKLDLMNWGVLRSDGTHKPKFVVGIKGQDGPLGHHAQADLGGFVVQIDGEPILLDPGYYRPKATDHSVLLIGETAVSNGKKQGEKAVIVDSGESGEIRHMTLDCTSAYPGTKELKRAVRHFVLVGDEALIVLDDIVAAGATITTQYQAAWPTGVAGGGCDIASPTVKAHLQTFGPELALKVEAREWNKRDWILKNSPLKWHAVSATYAADAGPLVTVIARDGAQVSASVKPGEVVVSLPGGKSVRFSGGAGGWKLSQ